MIYVFGPTTFNSHDVTVDRNQLSSVSILYATFLDPSLGFLIFLPLSLPPPQVKRLNIKCDISYLALLMMGYRRFFRHSKNVYTEKRFSHNHTKSCWKFIGEISLAPFHIFWSFDTSSKQPKYQIIMIETYETLNPTLEFKHFFLIRIRIYYY